MSRIKNIMSWTRRGAGALGLVALMMAAPGCDDGEKNDPDPTCNAGEAACECLDGGVCNDGLVCGASNTCEGAAQFGLVIEDPNARACEVLLVEHDGATVHSAAYVEGVEGALRRRAPNVAVALAKLEDSSFPDSGAATLTVSDTGQVDVEGSQTRCFDANGALMSGVTVSLQQ